MFLSPLVVVICILSPSLKPSSLKSIPTAACISVALSHRFKEVAEAPRPEASKDKDIFVDFASVVSVTEPILEILLA